MHQNRSTCRDSALFLHHDILAWLVRALCTMGENIVLKYIHPPTPHTYTHTRTPQASVIFARLSAYLKEEGLSAAQVKEYKEDMLKYLSSTISYLGSQVSGLRGDPQHLCY